MAQIVRNTTDLERRLQHYEEQPEERRPKLFAFILFDERESQRIVAEFARHAYAWLNELAGAARMVVFFFLRPRAAENASGGEPQLVAVKADETIENPSLHVARAFGLGPRDLPAIAFFTALNFESGPNAGVYWPLDLSLFEGDRRHAEDEFARLFSLVQDSHQPGGGPADVLEQLRIRLEALEREDLRAPIFAALRRGALKVITFPGSLVRIMGETFAAELARRVAQNP